MLGKLLLNPWVLLGIGVALVFSHGWVFIKATDIANNAWKAEIAAATEKVRAEAAARNRKTQEDLRVLVDVQTKARLEAEAATEELRNALAADETDATITVGPDLDRLFCRAVGGGRGDGPCADPSGG